MQSKLLWFFTNLNWLIARFCPFCLSNVPETNHHLFDECPAWASIRDPYNPDVPFQHLPTCTKCVGVACIPVATLHLLKEIGASTPQCMSEPAFHIGTFPDLETLSGDFLSVWVGTYMMYSAHPLWKHCGYGVMFDSARQHPLTMTEIRAFACGLMYILSNCQEPLRFMFLVSIFSNFGRLCVITVFPWLNLITTT